MNDWPDLVNTLPQYNVAAALEAGMMTPDVLFLSTISQAKREEMFASDEWDVIGATGMAIRRMSGLDVTFHCYFDGEKFRGWCASINAKELLTGNQGGLLQSNCMTLFTGSSETVKPFMIKLGEMAANKAPYKGMITLEVFYVGNIPYYRNIRYGATFQLLHGYRALFGTESMDADYDETPGHFVASMRIWGYPYTTDVNATILNNVPVSRVPQTVYDGESHLLFAPGESIRDAWRNLYAQVQGLEKYGVCWRVDGDVKPRRIRHELGQKQILC